VTKPVFLPDLMREHRSHSKRLSKLEARSSSQRRYGPYTTGSQSIAAGQQLAFTWTHNLNLPVNGYTISAFLQIASGTAVPTWAVRAMSANSTEFVVNLPAGAPTVTFNIQGSILAS
jgi:hypothetical protein